jgi:hypothetical protein
VALAGGQPDHPAVLVGAHGGQIVGQRPGRLDGDLHLDLGTGLRLQLFERLDQLADVHCTSSLLSATSSPLEVH